MVRNQSLKVAALAGASVLALCGASPAFAADTPASNTEVSEIVVTATRVTRDGFKAPTPTTVIGTPEINARAPANVADIVNDLPQLTPSVTPATTIIGVGGGTGGANFLNLRSLGVNRTLVLLDGARVVPSSIAGGVDVNLMPQGLIKRVDVVTGGASAQWGSDAVAGVVNFVLDRNFTGFKGLVQGGESSRGDADNEKVNLTYGTAFAGGRGHFLLDGGYSHTGDIARYDDRPWYTGAKIINNPAYVAGNGQTQFLVASADFRLGTPGGLIISGPNAFAIQFTGTGTTSAFNQGTAAGTYKLGGTPNDISAGYQLLVPVRYANVYSRASYALTDTITGYAEASFASSETKNTSVAYPSLGSIVIKGDNAYLPASLAGTSFALGKIFEPLGLPQVENDRNIGRVALGLDGTFGSGWTWNAYYQYGASNIKNVVANDPLIANIGLATDAVLSGGQIVCRSTIANPTNGCQPLNPFGTAPSSTAAINYVTGRAVQETGLHENVIAASVHGELFSLPAGRVSVAAGAEYRTEQYSANADTPSLTNSYWLGNYKPGHGKYEVSEEFVDAVFPILKDLPFAKTLDFEGAVRGTNYSTSGQVWTYKAGLSWAVNDALRFRATHSRDIRAPNLNDLYLGGQSNSAIFLDPQHGNAGTTALQITSGNTALQPEIAATDSVGFIYRPQWFEGFSLSIDYYRINVDGAITTLTGQQIVNNCGLGGNVYCQSVIRNGAGTITQVNVVPFNAASEKEAGVDYEVSYTSDLNRLFSGAPGRFTVRSLGTNTQERSRAAFGVTTNLLGQISIANSAPPRWRWFNTLSYQVGPSMTQLSMRYIGPGVYDNTYHTSTTPTNALSINTNTIKSSTLFDISQSWKVDLGGHPAELFGIVENVFDTAPPVAAVASFLYPGVNPSYHDTIGRQFRIGLRFKY